MGPGVVSGRAPQEVGARSCAREVYPLNHGALSPAPGLLIFMYISVFLACICVPHVYGIHGGQKRALDPLDPLELELQMVMSLHIGPRIEPRSSARATKVLSTISPGPSFKFLLHLF